ncbi:unnamed protein product [Allacma fusca]|uniref:Eclosion hormone n=1 Tax=Allacma fusca TaxID=39272 RepID=A0A8J2KA45_9HEXA|nr:unnamed protein product [Allacma fusca]
MASTKYFRLSPTFTLVILGLLLLSSAPGLDGMHLSCIANCSQCVKIYAEFFDGRQCAEFCIGMRNWGDGHIDCNDPTSISRFIRYQ